jgi:hypothetical protein
MANMAKLCLILVSNKNVPFLPHYLGHALINWDNLNDTYRDSLYLLNIMLATILYVDNVVMLSKLRASLDRLLNNLNVFAFKVDGY